MVALWMEFLGGTQVDRNFVSLFRALPLWPNNLVPLDEVVTRVVQLLGVDEATAQGLDPLLFIGGILGIRSVQLHRYDGVTTVTGELIVGTELAFSPFQSYIGAVFGDTGPGVSAFPFALRVKDEPPTKNSDDVFEINENALDPQLAAFQRVEKDPEAGFLDVDSWQLRLRRVPAKLRVMKGVTRVEELVPNEPTRGFRTLPDQHVDAGIELSFDFDADGKLELWPPDPLFFGAQGEALTALDLELGVFQVDDSPVVIAASGISYHKADSPFPAEIEKPAGLPDDWEGLVARQVGGFWARVPTKPADEGHVYGLVVKHLFIGDDVFSARASFLHGGGPDDPFASTTPVAEADLPESRWSLRRIEVFITTGIADVLQIAGQVDVAAILDFFDFQPVQFELSLGRVLRELPDVADPVLFVEVQGSLAPVQPVAQPTADGRLRLPLVAGDVFSLKAEINGVRFALQFPGREVVGVDLPTTLRLQTDLSIEIGEGPAFVVGASGAGFQYVELNSDSRFEPLFEGLWLETKKASPLDIFGYKFSISRISFGFDSGDLHAYWLGFDAHLEFPDALGRAEVYGMRFGWDEDGALFSIEGVGIAVKTPAIEFTGIVRFLDGSSSFVPEGEEPITIQPGSVAGLVRLAFPAASTPLVFQVGLMHGKYVRDAVPNTERSFWMLSAELILPMGIALGLGDLSLYGGAVAFGNNVAPRKAASTPWFDWYSKEAPTYDIFAPTKWTAAHGRSAFGLGLTVGSALKSGYPHNERVLGMLNTASESAGSVWLFAGQARFLKEITASGKPNVAILIVIAPDQILIRGEFHFSFPADGGTKGLVKTARGMVEIFIDQSGAGRHHLYLGRNLPYSERISAEVLLGFFTSRSFFMIDWADLALSSRTLPAVALAFGFAHGWEIDKRFGPLRFYLEAGIELEVGFSFAPAVYGFLRIYGGAGLRIWGFGFGLTVDAAFTLFVSDGWEFGGELRIKLNLPWPVPDYRKTLEFHWGPGANPPVPILSPLRQMALSSLAVDSDNPVREWSESNQASVPADFDGDRPDLAVDGSLVFALRAATSNNVPWIAGVDVQPVDGSGEWTFRYFLENIIIRRRLPGGAEEPVPDTYKTGFWEIASITPATPASATTADAPITQAIRIWGDLPGEQLRNLGGLERAGSVTWIEGFLDRFGTWPCGPEVALDPTCVHFDLVSFRLLDASYSRATLLPDGTPILSRSLLNPDVFILPRNAFIVLDEVVPNPRPDLWDEHEHCLRLPYLYLASHSQGARSPLPRLSVLEVKLPPSVDVIVTVIGVLPAETFVLQAFAGSTAVAESPEVAGSGLHVLTVQAPAGPAAIDRVRLTSVNRFSTSDAKDPSAVSVLASVCYRTVEQRQLAEHIVDQRSELDRMTDIVLPPPGLPGENGDHFHLHPTGTEYTITPVVSSERKGPGSGWDRTQDHLDLVPITVTAGLPPDDLRPYLDETLPAAEQDPVYLDDDVQLRFNRAYGPEMYTISGFDFRVEVLDAQRNPLPTVAEWAFSEEPALSPAQELLVEILAGSPCIDSDLSAVRKKLEVVLRPTLAPRALHFLVIRSSAHPRALFDIPFSTSRYHSFSEQALEVGANVRHELLPRPLDSEVFRALLTTFPPADREEENAALEQAWEDGLGFSFRERPLRGEVIVLYAPGEDGPGEPKALLLDSPEPLLVAERTDLVVTSPGGVTTLALRSIDGARTLVFAHAAGEITSLPLGDYQFGVTYRRQVDGLPVQRVAGDSSPATEDLAVTVVAEAQVPWEAL